MKLVKTTNPTNKDIEVELEGKEAETKKTDGKDQFTQWIKRGKSTFIPADNSKTVPRVDSGIYKIKASQQGPYLFKKKLKLDELLILPSKAETEVLEGIQNFWEKKDKFKEYGFNYKRGILLYGPPGTGKTCLINIICEKMIKEHDGVIFTISSSSDLEMYASFVPEMFRTIEPNRPIITIIEDIDGLCSHKEVETLLINVLDGIEQMDNVIYLATTNYTEKLPARLLNRPNRFDRRIKIGYPSPEVREAYLLKKLKEKDVVDINKSDKPLSYWVESTKDFTLAHLCELIKSVIILGNSFDETIALLRGLKEVPMSSSYNQTEDEGIGFKKSAERMAGLLGKLKYEK